MRRLLLVSNSTMHGSGYLEHVRDDVREHLQGCGSILFVPWALADHEAYANKAAPAFETLGLRFDSIHRHDDALAAVDAAEAVFVGGGNTFRLLDRLQRTGVGAAIAARALDGMPYMGSSAGTNVATLSIRTTNDMPIVQPASFQALGLVPFQINPHFLDADPGSTHMGETREQRLMEFHEENSTPVLGLREGGWLVCRGDQLQLRGSTQARLFRRGQEPNEIDPPADLSFLLDAGETTR
jgi:dipeptidase E